jgi:hypothetical protein
MINSELPEESNRDDRVDSIVAAGPYGALALAGIATTCVVAIWNGAPVRGIAPCGACHGSLDNKTGSPWLEGINTMLVPGYVSQQFMRFDKTGDYLMPCQEFCSFGHEGMWGKVRVIDQAEFASLSYSPTQLNLPAFSRISCSHSRPSDSRCMPALARRRDPHSRQGKHRWAR